MPCTKPTVNVFINSHIAVHNPLPVVALNQNILL
jgi:hypothetical protein